MFYLCVPAGKQVEITVVVVRTDAVKDNVRKMPNIFMLQMQAESYYRQREDLLKNTLLCNYRLDLCDKIRLPVLALDPGFCTGEHLGHTKCQHGCFFFFKFCMSK